MDKTISSPIRNYSISNGASKIVALTFGVLTVVFLAAFYVIAWQEPTQAPPGGNVATPLNISSTGQIKTGWLATLKSIFIGGAPSADEKTYTETPGSLGMLRTTGGVILNTGGAATGLIVQQGASTFAGNVGIGTNDPGTYKLKVAGDGSVTGDLNIGGFPSWQGKEFIGWINIAIPGVQDVCVSPNCTLAPSCTLNCERVCSTYKCSCKGIRAPADCYSFDCGGVSWGGCDVNVCREYYSACLTKEVGCGGVAEETVPYHCLCECPGTAGYFTVPAFK